ncbi:cytochrome c554/c'-like protein [Aliiruegeria haliotis]|uniref:Cytochrome c554/c'-like protein n=1 Tax=Aliiruegeria haliotis TaxID=1280846 RepID=A0A2T0S047_9RHOB|nr:cytochrome c3 family protein [Aliiruegeria haliotis]PRY26807.1 cytochrome c554/c'-like protein [Aliiruegeria haliotis]
MAPTHFLTILLIAATGMTDAAFSQEAKDPPAYVGTDACIDCHTAEYEDWTGSHHDLAWTEPTGANIVADFDNTSFTHRGLTSRFTEEDGTYYIESDGPDGQITKWPVAGVIGIEPLQQYFVETEPGRYQSFDVPWDTVEQTWYHMYPDQHLPASDAFHWTGPYKTWNNRCAECHATNYERNYDPRNRQYSSTMSEIGVGCEACHGPGAAHLAWAETESQPDDWPWDGLSDFGFTIDYAPGDAETEIQQCAACHARRGPFLGGSPVPGTPFHDAYRLSPLRSPHYHPDGQILDEVYVYGSFLQSTMYQKGVVCSDCHDVHAAKHHLEGNGVCLTCHSPAGNPDFPSLKIADYDTPEHHFHESGSEGAQCKACHMIERDYMGIDGRRDHSFRVPRPDLTIATGSPNACTDCHATEGPYWAQAELEKRFPESEYRGPHFATTFHAANQGQVDVSANLLEIAMAETMPGIVRATAMELLQPYQSAEVADAVVPALEDADPMVRAYALALQRAAPATEMVPRLLPLLEDPTRLVRIAAAREMLSAPIARLPEQYQRPLSAATSEWQSSLAVTADFPETHIVLGGIGLTTRNIASALASFREAVRIDPQMAQAWVMIVRLEAATGNEDGARAALAEALAQLPDDPGLLSLQAQLP